MRYVGLALLTVACAGEGGSSDDGDGTAADPFDSFVNTEDPTSGTFDGFTPVPDAADVAWLSQDIDPAKQAEFPINGLVEDFEEATAVASATVALFTDDVVDGAPDLSAQSDVNGRVTLTGRSCEPSAYRVTTEGGAVLTKRTYKAHQIYPFPDGASIDDAEFVSVSDVTYRLIPGILGVEVQPDLAIIAGTAYDVTRDPSQDADDAAGKIEGAQVVVYDADGNIPDTLQVNYFIESFPARDQKSTSEDGLWVASNVPAGDLRVELWGNVGGELVLLGASELTTEADSINIANIFSGYGDGVKYPASCEAP